MAISKLKYGDLGLPEQYVKALNAARDVLTKCSDVTGQHLYCEIGEVGQVLVLKRGKGDKYRRDAAKPYEYDSAHGAVVSYGVEEQCACCGPFIAQHLVTNCEELSQHGFLFPKPLVTCDKIATNFLGQNCDTILGHTRLGKQRGRRSR